jgi:flavodoxin
MKALVVYYSRTGWTAKLAKDIADPMDCEVDPIVDTLRWTGIIGWLKAGRGAMKKTLTKLEPSKLDPAQYDLVIVGTPIWASNVCVPTRTYLHDNKGKLKRVAFFVTGGGDKFGPVFAEMEAICGQRPVATLGVRMNDVKRGDHGEKVGRFVAELGK